MQNPNQHVGDPDTSHQSTRTYQITSMNRSMIFFTLPLAKPQILSCLPTHHGFSVDYKLGLFEWFGQEVGWLAGSGDWVDGNFFLSHVVPKMVEFGADVLGAWAIFVVLRHL
jgi:hypothetical protein